MTHDGADRNADGGDPVTYDDGFHATDTPVVPIVEGDEGTTLSKARGVLDAAADRMGRDVHWRPLAGGTGPPREPGPLPDETIRTLRRFRVGLIGPPENSPQRAATLEIHRQLGLTAAVDHCPRLDGLLSPQEDGGPGPITVFRDLTTNTDASLGRGGDGGDNPISKAATEALVDAAMGYALDRDRDRLTIVHGGDGTPAGADPFRDWALARLAQEFEAATVDERTFLEDYDGRYPDDEVVVSVRETETVRRELPTRSEDYDVLVAPAQPGRAVAAVAAEARGLGVAPGVSVGDGRLMAITRRSYDGRPDAAFTNLLAAVLSGSLLFEYLGWDDVVTTVQTAVSATLAADRGPTLGDNAAGEPSTPSVEQFTASLVERLDECTPAPGAGGTRTTPTERSEIRRIIAGVHNVVFADELSPQDIELNQLFGEDEEADVYLPEVGLNFTYWQQWSVERRLEVLLHELAHVEQGPDEPDHGAEFYDRFVDLAAIAADRRSALEGLFGESIAFGRVRRFVVESVHEETIEPHLETVAARKQSVRRQLDVDTAEHY